jgi:O-antigen ligase
VAPFVAVLVEGAVIGATVGLDIPELGRQALLVVAVASVVRLLHAGFERVERFVVAVEFMSTIAVLVALVHLRPEVLSDEYVRLNEETGWNPNALGYVSATVTVIALSNLLERPAGRWTRYYHWLVMSLGAFATLVTKSRTSIVGLAVGIGIVLLCARRNLTKYALLIIIGAGLYAAWGALPTFVRSGTIGAGSAGMVFSGRELVWNQALSIVSGSPIVGEGFVTFGFDPHNWYLAVMMRVGFLGMGCYLYVLFRAILRSAKATVPVHWPQALVGLGLVESTMESRLINYGVSSGVMLLVALLMLASYPTRRVGRLG